MENCLHTLFLYFQRSQRLKRKEKRPDKEAPTFYGEGLFAELSENLIELRYSSGTVERTRILEAGGLACALSCKHHHSQSSLLSPIALVTCRCAALCRIGIASVVSKDGHWAVAVGVGRLVVEEWPACCRPQQFVGGE